MKNLNKLLFISLVLFLFNSCMVSSEISIDEFLNDEINLKEIKLYQITKSREVDSFPKSFEDVYLIDLDTSLIEEYKTNIYRYKFKYPGFGYSFLVLENVSSSLKVIIPTLSPLIVHQDLCFHSNCVNQDFNQLSSYLTDQSNKLNNYKSFFDVVVMQYIGLQEGRSISKTEILSLNSLEELDACMNKETLLDRNINKLKLKSDFIRKKISIVNDILYNIFYLYKGNIHHISIVNIDAVRGMYKSKKIRVLYQMY